MTDEPADEGPADTPGAGASPPATPRAGRRRPWVVLAAVAGVVVAAGAIAVLREPPPEPDGLVILYGDSLSFEARGPFADELAATTDADLLTRVVPGTAPCDHRPRMEEDREHRPDVVVIQFVGNNASGCLLGPDGEALTGQALADRTEADVRAAVEMWAAAGARVVLVGGPDAPGLPGGASLRIADAYNRIVNEWAGRDLGRVRYADAAATVTGPDHAFAETLPCRDGEDAAAGCEDGMVRVRSSDRIHFCTSDQWNEQTLRCTVSPGATRFGQEMARVTALALDPGY